jgi:GTP-binding protein EngB required for normal cell division
MSDNDDEIFKEHRDGLINEFKVFHSNISTIENGEVPLSEVRDLYADIKRELQLKIADLEQQEFRIAFVGGFNSGKSTLINAIIGEYILPEANKALTSVPTHLRKSNSGKNEYFAHYLSKEEVAQMKLMYREELARELGNESVKNLGDEGVIAAYEKRIRDFQEEGRIANLDPKLLNHFKEILTHEKKISKKIMDKPHIASCSYEEAFRLIQDNVEGAFVDKVEVQLKELDIPSDVVIVDLPGVSVPNPRHRNVTIDFIKKSAHAVVLVLHAKKVLDRDENSILKNYIGANVAIHNKIFWVINHWDVVTDADKKDVNQDIEQVLADFGINTPRIYRTSARDGLLAYLQLHPKETGPANERIKGHLDDYNANLKVRYDGSHAVAYNMSQVESVQRDLFSYLNTEIKKTTLTEMIDNILLRSKKTSTVLQKAQMEHQHYLTELIDQEKTAKQEEDFSKKKKALTAKARETLENILRKVVEEQGTIKAISSEDLWGLIQNTYTHNLDLPQEFRLIMYGLGRKTPLYFEIETKVLTRINELIKEKFAIAQREGIDRVFSDYESLLDGLSRFISEELKGEYIAELDKAFKDIILAKNRDKVSDAVELLSNALMSDLDQLMVWNGISEEDLFSQCGLLDSWESLADKGQASLREMKDKTNQVYSCLDTLKKRLVFLFDWQERQNFQNHLADIKERIEQIEQQFEIMRKLLQYAYPANPSPAIQLTKIAKVVPGGTHDSEAWEKKADLFRDFLEKVYKEHMIEVVEELNQRTWLNVRDTLAKTGQDIGDLLSKYVIPRLEATIKHGISQEFKKKREMKEKLQELIGANLKPFIEAEDRLSHLREKIVS